MYLASKKIIVFLCVIKCCFPLAVEVRPAGEQPPSTPLVLKYYNPMYAVNYLSSNFGIF